MTNALCDRKLLKTKEEIMKRILSFTIIIIASLCLNLAIINVLRAEDHHHDSETKNGELKVKDYVSGSVLMVEEAKYVETHKGIKFYFESDKNKSTFQQSKNKYFKVASNDFRFLTNQVFKHYFSIQRSLSKDSTEEIKAEVEFITRVLAITEKLKPKLDKEQFRIYKRSIKGAKSASEKIEDIKDFTIKNVRLKFWRLSKALIIFSNEFNDGSSDGITAYVIHCPMAFQGKGASWLQDAKETANPFYGSEMLRCGRLTASHIVGRKTIGSYTYYYMDG